MGQWVWAGVAQPDEGEGPTALEAARCSGPGEEQRLSRTGDKFSILSCGRGWIKEKVEVSHTWDNMHTPDSAAWAFLEAMFPRMPSLGH